MFKKQLSRGAFILISQSPMPVSLLYELIDHDKEVLAAIASLLGRELMLPKQKNGHTISCSSLDWICRFYTDRRISY